MKTHIAFSLLLVSLLFQLLPAQQVLFRPLGQNSETVKAFLDSREYLQPAQIAIQPQAIKVNYGQNQIDYTFSNDRLVHIAMHKAYHQLADAQVALTAVITYLKMCSGIFIEGFHPKAEAYYLNFGPQYTHELILKKQQTHVELSLILVSHDYAYLEPEQPQPDRAYSAYKREKTPSEVF